MASNYDLRMAEIARQRQADRAQYEAAQRRESSYTPAENADFYARMRDLDRTARRQAGEGYSDEIYRDDEAPGSGWVAMCAWGMILLGLPMLAIFPPLAIVMLIAGPVLLTGNKTVIEPTETAMYDDVHGKGATVYTVGRLLWTGFVGLVVVLGTFGLALLFVL